MIQHFEELTGKDVHLQDVYKRLSLTREYLSWEVEGFGDNNKEIIDDVLFGLQLFFKEEPKLASFSDTVNC